MPVYQGNNMPKVKKQNEEAIRAAIYRYGPVSRSSLALLLALTPPTITTNVQALIGEGLVRELPAEAAQPGSMGRRPIDIDFIPDAAYALGCEPGPYHTGLCLTDLRGRVVGEQVWEPAGADCGELVRELSRRVDDLVRNSRISQKKILGLGIGVPGFLDGDGTILRSGIHAGWNGYPLARDVAEAVGMPVVAENNVHVRAVREVMDTTRDRADSFAYFYVSRGIGCTLMARSGLLTGEITGAGEAGHMVMERGGEICPTCGNNGCLEAYASDRAIGRKCAALAGTEAGAVLRRLCRNPEAPTVEEALAAQAAGVPGVDEILRTAVEYLGIALANIINFISPAQVLVDSALMQSEANRRLMRETVSRNLLASDMLEVGLEFIEADALGGAKGAAALAIREYLIHNSRRDSAVK
ncbi:ROK family protein [Ruminococcaceae bacterium OttesenSCG-928-L11]|nr:ROK family protein [Ruminococcaceae bacterium OttesenSCG-928-L11]